MLRAGAVSTVRSEQHIVKDGSDWKGDRQQAGGGSTVEAERVRAE